MKSSAIFTLSPWLLSPKPNVKTNNFGQWKQRTSHSTQLHCAKMFVPGFGEASPEAKAANNLHHFFTYMAVKIVAAQLQSYNPEAYKDLMAFLETHSLNDGDEFCATLMRESPHHKTLAWMACFCKPCGNITSNHGKALRILEVRSVYCKDDFDWDKLKLEAAKKVDESNILLMTDYVRETTHEK